MPSTDASFLPDEAILRKERRRRIEIALKKLSPKIKEVLILRYAADMSYREISETLGIRLGTVKSRIFAGMEKLYKLLEGEVA